MSGGNHMDLRVHYSLRVAVVVASSVKPHHIHKRSSLPMCLSLPIPTVVRHYYLSSLGLENALLVEILETILKMADNSAVTQEVNPGVVESVLSDGNAIEEETPNPITLKSLKIQFGVIKRLTKDIQMYEKEAAQQRTLVTKYVSEEKEATILKNARECLKETEMMIPDVSRRLSTAVNELKSIVDANRHTPVGKTPEFQEALSLIDGAANVTQSH